MNYHVKYNRLYVPPSLGKTLQYWFHASQYGAIDAQIIHNVTCEPARTVIRNRQRPMVAQVAEPPTVVDLSECGRFESVSSDGVLTSQSRWSRRREWCNQRPTPTSSCRFRRSDGFQAIPLRHCEEGSLRPGKLCVVFLDASEENLN